ncbi:hypothetical protein GS931_21550 [Rhodococcus hoagii]|nr:hypothetical protein [Prescottella equi]
MTDWTVVCSVLGLALGLAGVVLGACIWTRGESANIDADDAVHDRDIDAAESALSDRALRMGRGTAGEPDVLVTAESTSRAQLCGNRARRVSAALSQNRDEFGVVQLETLYLPNATIVFERKNGELIVVHRDTTTLGARWLRSSSTGTGRVPQRVVPRSRSRSSTTPMLRCAPSLGWR